ncbi:MAG: hypothetical protein R3B72_37050 [Polyangiaceae bacterium]
MLSPTARARLRRLLILAFALPCLAFGAINLVDDEAPPPLFTEDDLRPRPPDGDNGWLLALAADAPAKDGGEDRSPAFEAACLEAYRRPRFADPCELDGEACPVIGVSNCHRALTERAARQIEVGELEAPAMVLRHLLRADRDALLGARSILTDVLALDGAAKSLELAVALRGALGEPSGDLAADLSAALRELPTRDDTPSPGEKGSYVATTRLVEAVAGGHHGWLHRFLLDRGETLTRLAEGSTRAVDNPLASTGWWLDNATGDVILSSLDGGRRATQLHEERYMAWLQAARLSWRSRS